MELLQKPLKTKLNHAAEEYFTRNPNSNTVGFLTKEGREMWFRRDPKTGKALKISREEAVRL